MTDVIGPAPPEGPREVGPGTPGPEIVGPGRVGPPDNPGGDTTCPGCGAPLAPDQRYCLACGRPCSPVRLAFLDVLQAEHQPSGAYAVGAGVVASGSAAPPYPPQEPDGMLGSLRRYSGLLALLGVLVGCLLVGLLVGHWVSANNAPTGPQVVRIEGLSGPLASAAAPAATATSTTSHASTTPSSTTTGAAKTATTPASSKAEEAEEAKEAKEKEAKPPPVAHKTSSKTLQKISETTGKKHAQEVNALGNAPIETGH
jgi:hypothetical protein